MSTRQYQYIEFSLNLSLLFAISLDFEFSLNWKDIKLLYKVDIKLFKYFQQSYGHLDLRYAALTHSQTHLVQSTKPINSIYIFKICMKILRKFDSEKVSSLCFVYALFMFSKMRQRTFVRLMQLGFDPLAFDCPVGDRNRFGNSKIPNQK